MNDNQKAFTAEKCAYSYCDNEAGYQTYTIRGVFYRLCEEHEKEFKESEEN